MNIKMQRFISQNGSLLLSLSSLIGFAATVVLTAKETPKAIEKYNEEINRGATKAQAVIRASPKYLPAILTGISTTSCIIGGYVFNDNRYKRTISAYNALSQTLTNCMMVVQQHVGEEEANRILVEAHNKTPAMIPAKKESTADLELFYDPIADSVLARGGYFWANRADVWNAFYNINENLSSNGGVSIYQYLTELGFDNLPLDLSDIGWSSDTLSSGYDTFFIHFNPELVDNGGDGIEDDMPDFWYIHILEWPEYNFWENDDYPNPYDKYIS